MITGLIEEETVTKKNLRVCSCCLRCFHDSGSITNGEKSLSDPRSKNIAKYGKLSPNLRDSKGWTV